jgi:hypothetical protein
MRKYFSDEVGQITIWGGVIIIVSSGGGGSSGSFPILMGEVNLPKKVS